MAVAQMIAIVPTIDEDMNGISTITNCEIDYRGKGN